MKAEERAEQCVRDWAAARVYGTTNEADPQRDFINHLAAAIRAAEQAAYESAARIADDLVLSHHPNDEEAYGRSEAALEIRENIRQHAREVLR